MESIDSVVSDWLQIIISQSRGRIVWQQLFENVKFKLIFMKMAVFWVVALCSLVEVYLRFISACCFHHQGHE
jgi:hypothetical protein